MNAFALFWSIMACQGLRAVIDGPREKQKETRRAEAIRIAGTVNANRQMAKEHENEDERLRRGASGPLPVASLRWNDDPTSTATNRAPQIT
jgi:hypothetical protein